jgi:hypothetical protein
MAVAAGTAVLCALPAIVAAIPVPASALPAAQLRSRILASGHVPYQGYAESTVSLDLPDLPDISDVTSLLDGSTDQYAWYRSPDEWRSAVLTTAGETDVYQTLANGTFQWSYASNLLTQLVGSQPVRLPRAADLLPPSLALRLLDFAGPSDRVARLPSERIAGFDAAGLRLAPAGPGTTVAAVDIWADPASGLPVEVEVFGRGSAAPVLVSRFLSVSLTRPSLATVRPALSPAGMFSSSEEPDVEGIVNGYGPLLPARLGGVSRSASPAGLPVVAAYGTGFARFAVLPLPQRTGAAMISAASSAGASIALAGGTAELITTPLLTVLLTQSASGQTFLLTGAVSPAVLERAADGLADLP